MNLDENESDVNAPVSKPAKLSRKEKKALKAEKKKEAAAEKEKARAEKKAASRDAGSETAANPVIPEEVSAQLEPAPIPTIPPPQYTLWEKISPPARRKRQMANMEDGFREVLGLVRCMRENQEALLDSFQKLPEAVDSVKKLADHSARQSELLEAMNSQGENGPLSGKFNETLASMDNTTQLLLEQSQRSEERLYTMLRRAQRRIALMTLMVLLLFLGGVAGALYYVFPEETRSWLAGNGFQAPELEGEVEPTPAPTPDATPTTTEEPVKIETPDVLDQPPVKNEEEKNPVTPEPEVLIEAVDAQPLPDPTSTPLPLVTPPPLPAEISTGEIEEATPSIPEGEDETKIELEAPQGESEYL